VWQKGKYGLYKSERHTVIYWPDDTGWHVELQIEDIWTQNGDGWSVVENRETFKGAALVAPLTILYWSNEE
jgi:hypothetical protein